MYFPATSLTGQIYRMAPKFCSIKKVLFHEYVDFVKINLKFQALKLCCSENGSSFLCNKVGNPAQMLI